MHAIHELQQNQLLAALPMLELQALIPHLERVPMRVGDLLYKPDQALKYAYFPTTAVVSMYCALESGACAETTGVGNEGMVGVALFMGGITMPSSAVVQSAGHGYRLEPHRLVQAFEQGDSTRRVLLKYTQALINQICQTAVCYRHHSVEQQLSRWLLNTFDRVPSGSIAMTQQLVAGLLGARRESINDAAGKLRKQGYIRYRRGHISVLDRSGLESCACECFGVMAKEMHRLRSAMAAPARSDVTAEGESAEHRAHPL